MLRAGGVAIIGEDVTAFSKLKFEDAETNWRDHALTLPPTLVIESVSKGHEFHDRQTKRRWYAQFGVKHYWIVDGLSKSLDGLLLQGGDYISEATGKSSDVLTQASMQSLNIWLEKLWGD